MTALFMLPLDSNWTWRRDNASDAETPIARLTAWTASAGDTGTLVFSRVFDLAPLDVCVRYWLHSDALPDRTTVLLRDEAVAKGVSGVLAVDVTDAVMLEENVLRLVVEAAALHPAKLFGSMWLAAVPCE